MSAPEENVATGRRWKWRWLIGALVVALIVVALRLPSLFHKQDANEATGESAEGSGLAFSATEPPTVKMPADMVQRLGIKTAEVESYSAPRMLKLDGTLLVDPSNMARVHSRFPGEIVEMGPSEIGNPKSRPIRFGDHVQKGQLVAAVWCKDLGEKKSEFVDSILHLRLDDETLTRLRDLAAKGATPDQTVRQAEYRTMPSPIWIARSRAERTLASSAGSDGEIIKLWKKKPTQFAVRLRPALNRSAIGRGSR